jgi:hypothetical protein
MPALGLGESITAGCHKLIRQVRRLPAKALDTVELVLCFLERRVNSLVGGFGNPVPPQFTG